MKHHMRNRQTHSVYGTNSEHTRSKRIKRHWSSLKQQEVEHKSPSPRFNSAHSKAQTLEFQI